MLFDADFIIYIDGASRGNPGHASYGFAVLNSDGEVVHSGSGYIGISTNNVAEYTALREALRFALAQSIHSVQIRSDSELVVKQLNGEYKVKSEHLAVLNEECRQLLRRFEWYEIKHIPRLQNKIADRLANEALDEELNPRDS